MSNQERRDKLLDQLGSELRARLFDGIGSRRIKRTMDPISVAEELERRGASNEEWARALGVSAEMVREFRHILRLPEHIKSLVRDRRISIDKAYRLSKLKDKEAQQALAQFLAEQKIPAPVVREVVRLKNRNPDMPLAQCIDMALKSRPVREDKYVFVTSIEPSLRQVIEKEAQKRGKSSLELIKRVVVKSMLSEASILGFSMHDGLIVITLDRGGIEALRRKARELAAPLEELVSTLVKQSMLCEGQR